MMETASFQTPKTPGRSRFSKALPAPPPSFLDIGASLPKSPLPQSGLPSTPRKPLPQAPGPMNRLSDLPPPLPPPKEPTPKTPGATLDLNLPPRNDFSMSMAAVGLPRSPLDSAVRTGGSPLPRSPLDTRAQPQVEIRPRTAGSGAIRSPIDAPLPLPPPQKAGGPPLMSIPRRPVATNMPAVVSPVSPIQKSPVESISSLLSAYTDHSDDSTRRSTNSTNDSASTKDSYLDASPAQAPTKANSREGPSKTQSNGDAVGAAPTPNFSKRVTGTSQRPQTPPASQTSQTNPQKVTNVPDSPTLSSAANPVNSADSPTSSSPRQPQIWQRRSLKTEKTLGISELKLVSSHGSTAASATLPPLDAPNEPLPQPPQARPKDSLNPSPLESTTRSPLPPNRSPLPGRNIRPTAPRQPPVEKEEQKPGREVDQFMNSSKQVDTNNGFLFQVESLKTKLAEPRQTQGPDQGAVRSENRSAEQKASPSLAAPPKQQPRANASPASPPALPPNNRTPPVIVEHGPSSPEIKQSRSSPVLSRPPGGSPMSGLPTSPSPGHAQQPQGAYPPRGSSRPSKPQGSPQLGSLDMIAESRTSQDTADSDEYGTIRPGMTHELVDDREPEDSNTDHPGAALFPRGWYTPVAEEAQAPVRPITDIQRSGCYTGHRAMGRRHPEGTCAAACQACGAGTLKYRVCAYCTLLLCEDCTWALGQHGGNVQAVLEAVKAAA